MQQALIINIPLEVSLFNFNALDVGVNKGYVDKGMMEHNVKKNTVPQLEAMMEYFTGRLDVPLYVAMPGYLSEMIAKHHPKVFAQLQTFLTKPNVELLAVPYYQSSLHTTSTKELTDQITKQQQYTQQQFGKQGWLYLANEAIGQKEIEKVKSLDLPLIVHDGSPGLFATVTSDDEHRVIVTESATSFASEDALTTPGLLVVNSESFLEAKELSELAHAMDVGSFIRYEDFEPQATLLVEQDPLHELHEHVVSEMMGMHTFIKESEDDILLEDWRLLSQSRLLEEVGNEYGMYEQYASYMNILNDMAHKLRNVALTEQGIFETEPTIVDSPTEHVREVFNQQ